jgi:diguanylate cyclase (GGDEF)-like protein
MDGEKVEEVVGRAEAPAGLAFHVEDESERYGTIVVDKEDMTGDQVEYLSTFANVAALSLKNSNMVEKLKERANTDYLTGLRNHRYFQERLAEEAEKSKRYGIPLSLIMIDIDNFKKFNDTYGHQFGDLALKTVAQTIRGTVRASDLAARYGREEMAVLLPNTNIEGACAIAGRICENIRRVVVSDGRNAAKVTVSVGVTEFKGDKDRLIREADEALYSAKRSGKDKYVAYAA